MQRIVVAIDPAVSNEANSDEHGIMVCGLGEDKAGYLLEDGSMKGSPRQAANRAVALHDKWEANMIIYEKNNGGKWIEDTIKSVRPGLMVEEVCATRGKYIRAEPISSLYELGVIHHYGTFKELEDQMCLMVSGDYAGEGSPDRVCAAVWGFTELFPKLVQEESSPEIDFEPHFFSEQGWMA
jgi:phage terminase large subunit-like protein